LRYLLGYENGVVYEYCDFLIVLIEVYNYFVQAGDVIRDWSVTGVQTFALPICLFVHNPERTLLVASSEGYGFRVNEADITASTRSGKQILNVKGDAEAVRVIEAKGDRVAIIGENRKLLVFPLEEVSELSRGKGVRLQRYKDGGMIDVTSFAAEEGLAFSESAGRRKEVPARSEQWWVARTSGPNGPAWVFASGSLCAR